MSLKNRGLEIAPSALTGTHDIDQDLVYSLYAYSGSPRWDLLHVTVVYTFKCTAECPAQLRISGENLITIDGQAIPIASLEFHRAKKGNYRFATDPGP